MKATITITALLLTLCTRSQTIFFTSVTPDSSQKSENFYSSITISDSLLLFNANDYKLYAYNKNTGQLLWNYYLGWKSNQPPFFMPGSKIWTMISDNETIQLDGRTGKKDKTLGAGSIFTQPFVKGDTAFFTGIYDGGCLFAYDLKADSILWTQFLAHGCSVTPFYYPDKIIANAEGDHWIELTHSGKLTTPGCDTTTYRFPSELPCSQRYLGYTHDNKKISPAFAEKYELSDYSLPVILTNKKNTFLTNEDGLIILGNNLKQKDMIKYTSLPDSLDLHDWGTALLLRADEDKVWFLYSDYLFAYNYKVKKTEKLVDLRSLEPHQVLMDSNRLWVISKNDKRLYGLEL